MTKLYRSRPKADEATEKIKVFAQPMRLMILSYLLEGEHTVGDIEQATGIRQPALSQQLAELRRAELVRTRRVVKQVYYRLADESAKTCVRAIEAMFGSGDERPLAATEAAAPVSACRKPSGVASFAQITPLRS